MDVWMDGCVVGWMDGWVDGRMDVCMYVWMDRWMDGWGLVFEVCCCFVLVLLLATDAVHDLAYARLDFI